MPDTHAPTSSPIIVTTPSNAFMARYRRAIAPMSAIRS
jgi:hypothetical protein